MLRSIALETELECRGFLMLSISFADVLEAGLVCRSSLMLSISFSDAGALDFGG